MRKFIVFVFALLAVMQGFSAPISAQTQTDYNCVAFIKTNSASEGSSFNFFFAAPLVQYVDNDGVCKGAMFNSFVFEPNKIAASPNEAEQFIADIMKEHENLDALENSAVALKEDGYADKNSKLKIYISVPFDKNTFADENEQKLFIEYFVNTLYIAFEAEKFANLSLAGLYFDKNFDEELLNMCKSHAESLKLNTISYEQLYHISLDGVPDNSNKKHYDNLTKGYSNFAMQSQLLGVHFDAFNTLHDCAIAATDGADNTTGRCAYDYVHDIITHSVVESQADNRTSDVEYAFYAFIASAATACGIYVIVSCLRKAFRK